MFLLWGFRVGRIRLILFLFSFLLVSKSAYSQVALDTWLVGQYDFSNNILDHTRYQNNLIGNAITYDRDRFCTPISSVYLNGSQNLVQTQTNGLNNQVYTFTFWLKAENISTSYATLIDIGSDIGINNGQRVVYTQNGNILAYSGTNANPSNVLSTTPVNIPSGAWVFVAVVRNRSNYGVYIDGNEVYHNVLQGFPATYYNQINPQLFIGSDPDQTHFYKGLLDDFHIYNQDLSSETIKAIYGFGTEKQISVDPSSACMNKSVTFHLDSTNSNGIIWDFGDPNALSGQNTSHDFTTQHTYSKAGQYVVTGLLMTDCSVHAPVSTVIRVGECAPPCKFPDLVTVSDSCLENAIGFGVNANPSIQSITWDFGDQSAKAVSNVFPFQASHKYTLPGEYKIKAEILDTCHQGIILYYPSLNINSCLPQPIPQIPSAFTPNGDGINDIWEIPALLYYPKCNVKIFDRWGNMVYYSPKGYSSPFDGVKNGTRIPMGTYYYFIQLKEDLKPLIGSVSVLY